MDNDCIFCQIASGETKSDIVYQDKDMVVFRDIHPRAPVHLLMIPRKHIPSLKELTPEDDVLIGRMIRFANEMAKVEGIYTYGYRLVTNCGPAAGQVVDHLHFHILGGQKLGGLVGYP